MQIKDKKGIIIGTVNRLGIAFCRELLRNGAEKIVMIGDREINDDEVSPIDELNHEFGEQRVTHYNSDNSKSSELDTIFKEAVNYLGGLEILINNADLFNEIDITKAVDVNIATVIRSSLLGVQQMGKDMGSKGGIIVNVASIFGLEPVPQLPVYSTAKQAVISFSRSFSQPYHFKRTGVKVVVLCPGLSKIQDYPSEKYPNNDSEVTGAKCATVHPQKVETVAHGLVYVIRCAQNGSIWITDFPDRKSRRASAEEKAKELEIIKGIVCGKNVVITGGASGLGYSFVNHFLEHGAKKIAIIDVDTTAGEQAVKAVTKTYGAEKIIFINADTSNYSQIHDAFAQLTTSMDSIDIVVNNAGILDERRWEREIAINISGMLFVANIALQFMGKDQGHNGGVLVNIGQHFDFKTTAQLPVYTATKSAMIGLSKSLGAPYHYERTGVRVLALCPGLTETALTINSPNRLSSRIMKADFVKNLENLSIQTPYIVAKGLMTILKCGESGSIWVIDNGNTPYEVVIPHYQSLKRSYKNNFIPTLSHPTIKGRPMKELRIYDNNIRSGLTSCA
ncbi:Similar to HPGD: 15-hydroxyprostaglandin dehydrogenase [NAD()] (Homo sapiens) [Cotesia congregata]|uniref:Similar to HPGD: 15-hydroxyprostaglandin dehydrogenase [NAD( )] (Homo sapiens) n=1 Tax=Cotesia congregata TaxID=51543 RepID=A0A8J2MXN6_COTCN|nr:Similar to HPGD: 15-hydroxyprostaglandin dehydrogenase [NAD()] (Homo sapiens) [Cotesia congregata]